jgi:peptidoglycan hydrolase FlgJ
VRGGFDLHVRASLSKHFAIGSLPILYRARAIWLHYLFSESRMITPLSITTPHNQTLQREQATLAPTAKAFEAMVISQMLQASGMNKPLDNFGGGAGEAQFSSFLTDAQAQALAARGGIGLAERLIRTMTSDGADT